MKRNSIFRKILKYALILVAVTVVSILAIAGTGLFIARQNILSANLNLGVSASNDAKQALISQMEGALLRLAQNQADLADEKLSNIIISVNNMALMATAAYNIYGNNSSTLDYLKRTVLAGIYGGAQTNISCYYATEQGDFIIPDNYTGDRPPPDFDPRTRLWYSAAKEKNGLIWTDVYEDNEDRGLAITCAQPFYNAAGRIAGVAGIGILINNLSDIIKEALFGETGEAFIFNENGYVIIANSSEEKTNRVLPEDNDENIKNTAKQIINNESGIERVIINKTEKFIAYSKLNTISWIFAIAIDTDEVIRPAVKIEENIINLTQINFDSSNRIIFTIFLFSIIAILIIIMMVIYISYKMAKNLVKPLLKLTSDVVLIGKGGTDKILETKTNDELEILSTTINEMVTSIKTIKAEKELADEAAHKAIEEKNTLGNLENVMNGLDVMIYVTDPNTGEILFINDCMKKHFNVGENGVGQLCYNVFQKNRDKRCDDCPCFRLFKEPDAVIAWEEHNTITNRIYHNVDRFINWPNGKTVHLQHSVDMTELIAAKEFAEQSSNYKSAFLANMSHEIRTPMNAILGIAEIQLRENNLPKETESALQKIYESGDLLLNIINDILDLSKIEAGRLELSPAKYDIPSLIHDTAQLIRLRYESNPIKFIIQVDQNTPLELFGDELRIKQVLNNVLSNAFKYTDEGEIEFSVFSEQKDQPLLNQSDDVIIVFRVRDTGQGMTKKQLDKLFDEYTRFNTEANRTTIGTGLGMSITKRIVNLLNGQISAESEPGKGSVFTIRIPQKKIGMVVCGPEIAGKLRDFKFQTTAITKKAQFFREYMPYGSVLVVDDMDSNIYVTKGMLMPYGLNIETASSGFEAVEKIKNGKIYDIIFMDHMMPKMDGIKAVEIIRGLGYKNSIIALTANALTGRAEMFMQNGFDGYISKPIDSRELNIALNEFIRNKKPQEAVEEARRNQQEKTKKNNNAAELYEQDAKKSGRISEKEIFFIHDAENAINTLEDINKKLPDINNEEIELYTTTVHGMKSALANIGEKELSALSYKLEQAGEEKNTAFIISSTPSFINALQAIADKLKPVNENADWEISAKDKSYLQDKLQIIKTECAVFNKNAVKETLDELKKKNWPARESLLLSDITLHLLHSAFKKAVIAIDNYLQ